MQTQIRYRFAARNVDFGQSGRRTLARLSFRLCSRAIRRTSAVR